ENARRDARTQVRCVICRDAREGTLVGTGGGTQNTSPPTPFDKELRVFPGQPRNGCGQPFAVLSGEPLRTLLPALRRIHPHPDAVNFLASAPEFQVALGVAEILHVLPHSGPVDVHSSPGDVAENPLVRRGLAPLV